MIFSPNLVLVQMNMYYIPTLPTFGFCFLAGVILIGIEFFFTKSLGKKYQFIFLLMGINALIMGFYTFRGNIYDRAISWLIIYWMGLSFATILWIRPILLLKGKRNVVQDATEAQTIGEISSGKIGKVIYEGCVWQARCEDKTITILPNQTVYVMRREGNILIVVPVDLFQM